MRPQEHSTNHLKERQMNRPTSEEYKSRRLLVFHAFLALKIPRMVGVGGGILGGFFFVFFVILRKPIIQALVRDGPQGW